MRYIRESKERTVYAVKNIFKQPLDSLGQIIPVAMILTSFVGFVVAIFNYLIDGGFFEQCDLLQKNLFEGISKGFTTGNVDVLTSGIVLEVIIVLLVIEFFIVFISFVLTESTMNKTIAGLLLSVGTILLVLAGVPLGVGFGVIDLPNAIEKRIVIHLFGMQGMNTSSLVSKLEVLATLGFFLLAAVLVIICVSKHRWMIGHSVIAMIISFLVIPAMLLLIENIIPMLASVLAFLIVCIFLFLFGKIMLAMAKSSKNQSFEETSHSELSRKTNIETVKKDVPYQKEVKCYSAPFWREKGGYGIIQAAEDHIYCYNAQKQVTAVCGVSKFEEGTVAIYDAKTKERVMHVEGCKTPKR